MGAAVSAVMAADSRVIATVVILAAVSLPFRLQSLAVAPCAEEPVGQDAGGVLE